MVIKHIFVCAGLIAVLVASLPAQNANQPRVSATDTSYLSCTAWSNNSWTKPMARSARTQMKVSPKGFQAFGEVKVVINDGSCENTTTLNVTPKVGQPFKIVYAKEPSASNGNGIHLIGWSPSGDKLLAEINLWEYETDSGYDHVVVIYDSLAETTKEVEAVTQSLSRQFGSNCEFELAVTGWKTDDQIIVKVSRPPTSESYKQRFCVQQPRTFVFQLSRNTLQVEQQ